MAIGQIKQKTAMLYRWWLIMTRKSNTAVRQGEGRFYARDKICGYYSDLTCKVGRGTLLDCEGLPLTQIGGSEIVHFPITVIQYGLGCWDKLLETGAPGYRASFFKIVDWTMKNQRPDGSWDAFSAVKSKLYTISSLCQGEGASLLFRAHIDSGDEKYKDAAFAAVDLMLTDTDKGGTAVREEGGLFLEEYPQARRRTVLNGWILSLFGLYDAALLRPDKYKESLECSIDTLCKTLSMFDTGYWSYYDLEKRLASPAYHDVHIALLITLGKLSGRAELIEYAARFETYQKSRMNIARAIVGKVLQKLTEKTDVVYVR